MPLLSGLASWFKPEASVTWEPLDERWYMPLVGGGTTDAGVPVSASTVLRCGVVLSALRFIADNTARCTPEVIRVMSDGRKVPAPNHPVDKLLRRPNRRHTGSELARQTAFWLRMWGNAYFEMLPSAGGDFVGELRPLMPRDYDDHGSVGCRVLDEASNGELIYGVRRKMGEPEERLPQSRILHYTALSDNAKDGLSTWRLMRNVVGIALASERHTGSFINQGTRLSGLLSVKGSLTEQKRAAIIDSWKGFTGAQGAGKVGVVGDEMTFQPITMNHREGQYLELTDQAVSQLLMFLGVPGVVVGWQGDKSSTYASAEAFFQQGGVENTLAPMIHFMERREEFSLLMEDDDHRIRRNLDALMRARTKARYEAHAIACGGPWMTRNEIRDIEDMNRIPQHEMDEVLPPRGIAPLDSSASSDNGNGQDGSPDTAPRQQSSPEDEENARAIVAGNRLLLAERAELTRVAVLARQLVAESAAGIVRHELERIVGRPERRQVGAAVKFADDPAGWKAWATQFYGDHAAFVARKLQCPPEAAKAYADAQLAALMAGGVEATEHWEETVPPRLVEIALEGVTQS